MLRITASTSAAGAKKYFNEGLQRDDYYVNGQELTGTWGGKGAKRLGLSGDVDRESFFALCDNRQPNGERLTPRTRDDRRVGYDFTFSAPKSVSILYELSGDERILAAFRDSVRETMDEVESEMKTRMRRRGADGDRLTRNAIWAEFTHTTSRPVNQVVDMHLHSHVYVFNATFDELEGRWQAAQIGPIKADGPYWEAAFDARLAKRLNVLGYATEKDARYSFEVAGVPESAIDRFSQRRNEVERVAAARGITDAKGKHEITRRGREKKVPGKGKDELRREWAARLSPAERDALATVIAGNIGRRDDITAERALDYAVAHSFVRRSTVSDKRLKAEALRFGVGSASPEDVANAVQRRADLINASVNGQTMLTTRDVLSAEVKMLRLARKGQGAHRAFSASPSLPDDLSGEQRQAALHVLQSRDSVTGVIGGAGTGKTYMMRATIGAVEKAEPGRRVFVFAPSAQASRNVLRGEGFANAETLQLLLTSPKMQDQTKGQVLWVDEAGLVSNRDMKRLLELADRNGNRVILSGDYRQHASVEAGDAFRLLESEAGVRYGGLREIRRQKGADYRKAVESISQGTPEGIRKGFDALDRMGAIVEAKGDTRHEVFDYRMRSIRLHLSASARLRSLA